MGAGERYPAAPGDVSGGRDNSRAVASGGGAAAQPGQPRPGRALRIDPGLPRASQQVPVTALPGFAAGEVTLTRRWRALAVVAGPEYTAWWPLEPGRHVFGAWASKEDGTPRGERGGGGGGGAVGGGYLPGPTAFAGTSAVEAASKGW